MKFIKFEKPARQASKLNKKKAKICHVLSCFILKKSVLYNMSEIEQKRFFCIKFIAL